MQAHIGRLADQFYDANKTGVLVSRIMSDVEGVRNLIGTGLVEFVGGVLTAVLALVILLRISALMTLVAFAVLLGFALVPEQGVFHDSADFPRAAKDQRGSDGRLTESLGGVRVVKGYHAEEREEEVFAGGVQRLLDNVLKTLTATSLMSLSGATLMGMVSAVIMYLGARQILAGTMTLGNLITYTAFLVTDGGAGISDRGHRHADDRSHYRAGAHARNTERIKGRSGPEAHGDAGAH